MKCPINFLVVCLLVVLAACGSDAPEADVAPVGASSSVADSTAATATTISDPPASTSTVPEASSTSTVTTPAVSIPEEVTFCSMLDTVLEAWTLDMIQPSDLTMVYTVLLEQAPADMIQPLEILIEGNDILLATMDMDALPNRDAYDAAGATVATYASEECGIEFEG